MSDVAIFNRVMDVLKKELTKEEWVTFCNVLDGGGDILDDVNEYVSIIAPELYCNPDDDDKYAEPETEIE